MLIKNTRFISVPFFEVLCDRCKDHLVSQTGKVRGRFFYSKDIANEHAKRAGWFVDFQNKSKMESPGSFHLCRSCVNDAIVDFVGDSNIVKFGKTEPLGKRVGYLRIDNEIY